MASFIKQKVQQTAPGRKRRLLQYGLLLVLAVMSLGIIINYRYLNTTIFSAYAAASKQQEVSKLDIYEKSYASVVANYYANALNTVESLASNHDTLLDMTTDKAADLSSIFQHQRTFENQFNTISAFSRTGQMVAVSTDTARIYPNITVNQLNAITQSAIAAHTPQLTSAFTSVSGRNVIIITAPISGTVSQYAGTIVATSTVSDLASRINFLSSNQDLSSIVTDSRGNILTNNNQSARIIMKNIAASEPIFKKLTTPGTMTTIKEANFNKQPVVAEGVRLSFDNAGSVYVISYLRQAAYQGNLNNLKGSIAKVSNTFIILNIAFLVFAMILLCTLQLRNSKQ